MFLCSDVYAYELDTSFDEEVRKKYNVEELNELNADKIKLPKLPDMPADEDYAPADLPKLPQQSYDYFPENYTGAGKRGGYNHSEPDRAHTACGRNS